MNDREWLENGEMEIDFRRIFRAWMHKGVSIAGSAVIGAAAMLLATFLLITPRYQSKAVIYVNNNAQSSGSSIRSEDLAASKDLVDSYLVILRARETLEAVIGYAGISKTYEQVEKMVSAAPVDATEFFEVVVTSPDPQEAELLANAITQVLPQRIAGILEGASTKIVDSAIVASRPSSPDYGKNTILGFAVGLLLAGILVCVKAVQDTTIREDGDIVRYCRYPVLASIPSGGSSENACDLVRMKVECLQKKDYASHVVGITSPDACKDKTGLAETLTASLVRNRQKAILICCDWQSRKRGKAPGLTQYLSGSCELKDSIHRVDTGKVHFPGIDAGQRPEEPGQLLESEKMVQLVKGLRRRCDYVILDLPSMAEPSDALRAARQTDGVLLMVRQNVSQGKDLQDAVEQLEFMKIPILGIVYLYNANQGLKCSKIPGFAPSKGSPLRGAVKNL